MASGADTQTDTYTHIPTREPKQFQETRRARPKAARAWFKNVHTSLWYYIFLHIVLFVDEHRRCQYLTLVLYHLFCLLCFLHGIIFFWKKRPQLKDRKWNDPSDAKLLSLSAKEAAAQIHSGNLSSQQLVQCYINRLKEVNPYLNAAISC